MKDDYRSITFEWIGKAESDLDYARASFRELERFYSHICILCHDSVEKFLKGCLASQGIRPERSHDLVALLNRCIEVAENKSYLIAVENPCRILNRYYIPLKYPSHYPAITKEQAREAIEAAGAVQVAITSFLGIAPLRANSRYVETWAGNCASDG